MKLLAITAICGLLTAPIIDISVNDKIYPITATCNLEMPTSEICVCFLSNGETIATDVIERGNDDFSYCCYASANALHQYNYENESDVKLLGFMYCTDYDTPSLPGYVNEAYLVLTTNATYYSINTEDNDYIVESLHIIEDNNYKLNFPHYEDEEREYEYYYSRSEKDTSRSGMSWTSHFAYASNNSSTWLHFDIKHCYNYWNDGFIFTARGENIQFYKQALLLYQIGEDDLISIDIGIEDAYQSGYTEGWYDGEFYGRQQEIDYAHSEYSRGYKNGQKDATAAGDATTNVFSVIKLAFGAVESFFNFTIAPGITIGLLISIPIAVFVLLFVIKLIGGH